MSKVLVVDDESAMRQAIADLLESEGFEVVMAPDGRSAVDLVRDHPVDAIVMDIRMPNMDGLQALGRIKTMAPLIPVVIVTGYGSAKTAVQAMQLGAVTLLEKPFDNDELLQILKKALSEDGLHGSSMVMQDHLGRQVMGVRPVVAEVKEKTIKQGDLIRWLRWTAVVLLLLGGSAWWVNRVWGWRMKTWPVSFVNPSALAWDGPDLWVSDWANQEISRQRVEEMVKVEHVIKMPGWHLTGLACSSTQVFLCDPDTRKISRHQKDGTLTLIKAISSPGLNPAQLFWDGTFLWSFDAGSRLAYQHRNDEELTVVATFQLQGKRPLGVVVEPFQAWSFDAEQNVVYLHNRDAKLSVMKKFHLPGGLAGMPVAAFAVKEKKLWLVGEGQSTMTAVKISALEEMP